MAYLALVNTSTNLLFFRVKPALLVLGIFALLFASCGDEELIADVGIPVDTLQTKTSIHYGIVSDSFLVFQSSVKKNELLSHILLRHHIPYSEIDALVKQAKDVFDVTQIRSGRNYTVLCKNDSTEKAQFFIYEPNATDFIVCDLRNEMKVYRGEKEVTEVRREVAGEINSSLYETLMDIDVSPAVAMKLSEIYAWSIDFYRIQKGDKFKVIFVDRYVEDTRVGVGDIQAALFIHRNEEFYAFPFDQGQGSNYFDENAKSLRKAFLKSPLKFGRISSGYTMKRYHPVQKRMKAHLGTDYAAPTGTPILSVGDGVVIEAKYSKFNGNYVKVKHNGTYTTQYLHMSKFSKSAKPGKYVKQGDVIGYVGSTGLATGPHVCFRFWKNGKQVNHRTEKLPPSLPVDRKYLPQFEAVKDSLKKELDVIPFEHNSKEVALAGV
ncbi:MAG: peptidoglycan DD-metalloendopeptidase family protein [Flavobacteriales bacterium]|nr:peptidoglycan DD-metalloendopeptidase family protein [Flavobacteriales bacterium]